MLLKIIICLMIWTTAINMIAEGNNVTIAAGIIFFIAIPYSGVLISQFYHSK